MQHRSGPHLRRLRHWCREFQRLVYRLPAQPRLRSRGEAESIHPPCRLLPTFEIQTARIFRAILSCLHANRRNRGCTGWEKARFRGSSRRRRRPPAPHLHQRKAGWPDRKDFRGLAQGGPGIEHAQRTKTNRGVHAGRFCKISSQIKKMIGSHAH